MTSSEHPLEEAARLVADLSTDPAYWTRVDVDFRSGPPVVAVTREPARRGLRDPGLGTPLPGAEARIEAIRSAMARHFEATRKPDYWLQGLTLTVYADGTFSIGSTAHAPRR